MRTSSLCVVLLAIAAIAITGCPKTGSLEGVVPVSGTVTQGGAPLAGAAITLKPTGDTRAASAITNDKGEFIMTTLAPGDGAFPGEYQVTITKKELSGKEYTEEEANEYYAKNQKQVPDRVMTNLLDKKYEDGATSGLTATVPAGGTSELTFDIE